MIVVEESLKELFNLIPDIQLNSSVTRKPIFSWGKQEELNRWVETYKSDTYPLIWLLPEVDTHNVLSDQATRRVILILATLETRKDLFNQQRWQGSYKSILNPLTDYVIQALQNSSITNIVNSNEIQVFKEPNYSNREENGCIDQWDALRIECEVVFYNNCLTDIKWR